VPDRITRRLTTELNRVRRGVTDRASISHPGEAERFDDSSLLVSVTVDDRVIEFAIEYDSADPIARLLATGGFPGDSVNDLWRHLVQPDHKVVDVGAHLGTYSLPAAAIASHVLAVEASPANAALLELAARRNSFVNLHVLQAVAAAQAGSVGFVGQGPYGHRTLAEEQGGSVEGQPGVEVNAVRLDDAIQARGWDRVDLVKLDIEGSEIEALAGLERLLVREDAPLLIVEVNGHMLHHYGYVPGDVLVVLERHGYKCHQIDPGPARRLVPVNSADVQPECVTDYLAFKSVPVGLSPWWVDRPFERAEVIRRVAATCRDEQQPHREYGARLLATAPAWLSDDELIATGGDVPDADEHS
jgi:FkbM family methyltransferase